MTVLANALLTIPQGQNTRTSTKIPNGLKTPGVAQFIKVSFDATNWPATAVSISIGISIDNGVSFRTASSTFLGHPFRGTSWFMTYSLDQDAVPTDLKLSTDSPSAFQTQTLVEAL